MELLQKILNGEEAEVLLSAWPEIENPQKSLKAQIKTSLSSYPSSKLSLLQSLTSPDFSLSLAPNLAKFLIKNNALV